MSEHAAFHLVALKHDIHDEIQDERSVVKNDVHFVLLVLSVVILSGNPLKVTPIVHSFIYSFVRSFIHSFIHPPTPSFGLSPLFLAAKFVTMTCIMKLTLAPHSGIDLKGISASFLFAHFSKLTTSGLSLGQNSVPMLLATNSPICEPTTRPMNTPAILRLRKLRKCSSFSKLFKCQTRQSFF